MSIHASSLLAFDDQQPQYYSPGELSLLKVILEETFSEWRHGRTAPVSPTAAFETKMRLAQVIFSHAATGERDPEYLKDLALDTLR